MNALLLCLCKIHNICIDNGNATPPERYENDVLTQMDFVNINDGDGLCPIGLLGGVIVYHVVFQLCHHLFPHHHLLLHYLSSPLPLQTSPSLQSL